jgi:hypothetical protein
VTKPCLAIRNLKYHPTTIANWLTAEGGNDKKAQRKLVDCCVENF